MMGIPECSKPGRARSYLSWDPGPDVSTAVVSISASFLWQRTQRYVRELAKEAEVRKSEIKASRELTRDSHLRRCVKMTVRFLPENEAR